MSLAHLSTAFKYFIKWNIDKDHKMNVCGVSVLRRINNGAAAG